jgi:hypothetical protein
METPHIQDRRRTPDRRSAPRLVSSGRVEITFDNPAPVVVEAELVELSANGFRAVHDSKALAPGTEVHYRRAGAHGRARVIWTHVLDQRRVSGFVTL